VTKAIPKDVRDLDEVRERIDGLTGVEALKLEQIARRFVAPCDAPDLLQEAFSRILEGGRNWPSDIEFLPFMAQVMRSIASTERRKTERRPELRVVLHHGEQLTFDSVADPNGTPEDIVGEWNELVTTTRPRHISTPSSLGFVGRRLWSFAISTPKVMKRSPGG
jgi:RNA polymerase sporulation-specific sigma factor